MQKTAREWLNDIADTETKITPMSSKKIRTKVKAGGGGEKPATVKKRGGKPQYSESQLQTAFFKWFRLQYPQYYWNCFAIPNGGKRDIVTASKLKKEGAVAGVWDVLILNNSSMNNSRGLFIEFKVGRNKLTEKQEAFKKANYYYDFEVCYTIEQAVAAVNNYLSN